MPKSRNRKDHKKKVNIRNNRLRGQRNALNKRIQELLTPKEVKEEGEIVTNLNNKNTETNN